MAFHPDANQRLQEGVQRYESQMEDLERAAQHGHHAQQSGRSLRWLWIAIADDIILVALFFIYQFSVPTEVPLQDQLGQ